MAKIDSRDALIGGGIASVVGISILAISIWADDAGFHAPRWVVGASGAVFLLTGFMIVTQHRPMLGGFFRALMLTAFGAVFAWVSFGPGEREFTSTVSIPFISLTRGSSDLGGRICFAPGALLICGLALYSWFLLARDLFLRDMRG
jgi:hypothetical protein